MLENHSKEHTWYPLIAMLLQYNNHDNIIINQRLLKPLLVYLMKNSDVIWRKWQNPMQKVLKKKNRDFAQVF